MSVLSVVIRPEVKFDVNKLEHRMIAQEFFKNQKWDQKHPKFTLDPQYLSVPHMIQAYLTDYYLTEEFV